jgi:hypothetical protein
MTRAVRILAVTVAVAAAAVAAWLHFGLEARSLTDVRSTTPPHLPERQTAMAVPTVLVTVHRRAAWQDAAAIVLLVAGLGTSVTLLHQATAGAPARGGRS